MCYVLLVLLIASNDFVGANIVCCACYLNRQSSPVDGPISKYKHVIIVSIGVKTYIKMRMGFL